MTSGPPRIPISTFEDVLHHKYKVISGTAYFDYILSTSAPGSAKHRVFNTNYELKNGMPEAIKAMLHDPDKKTLIYAIPKNLLAKTPSGKILANHAFALKMDDAIYGQGTFGLQRDSEFLQIFNYYILKALQGGVFKRLFRKYHIGLFTNKNFEMIEAQPLGLNNVMFCLTSLGVGICLSIIQAMMELMYRKTHRKQEEARTGWATISTTREVK